MIVWINNQAFAPYYEWEDYLSGFYKHKCNKPCNISKSREMLLSHELFYQDSLNTFRNWPVTCLVHLTNNTINRKAWIGHAAAYFNYGVCEACTVKAWHSLNENEQYSANNTADAAVKEWIEKCASANSQTQKRQLELMF